MSKPVPVMMGIASPTGSHLPTLTAAIEAAPPGSLVIEHGAGMYSTPLLCRYPVRVLCAESHPGWVEWAHWMYAGRDYELVDTFKAAVPHLESAAVVFIDGVANERGPLLKCALERGVPTIIVHDTEESEWVYYRHQSHFFSWRGYSVQHFAEGTHRTTRWLLKSA